jgi:hypothetical protein
MIDISLGTLLLIGGGVFLAGMVVAFIFLVSISRRW